MSSASEMICEGGLVLRSKISGWFFFVCERGRRVLILHQRITDGVVREKDLQKVIKAKSFAFSVTAFSIEG